MAEEIKGVNDSLGKKKKTGSTDRVNLTRDSALKLASWQKQMAPFLTGVKLNRSDLVNWMMAQQDKELSDRNVQKLALDFFDPVKALEIAMKEAKSLAASGEKIDINILLASKLPQKKNKVRCKKRSSKAKNSVQLEESGEKKSGLDSVTI